MTEQLETETLATWHYLHTHTEISMQEWKTTAYISDRLTKMGYQVTLFKDFPGLMATFGTGRPVVGIRSDIDALYQYVDRKWQANHSCGHDANMTIVLETARLLMADKNQISGTVKLIFQPAEETGEGAYAVNKIGAADDLDYFYGIHLRPIAETVNGHAEAAILHGAVRRGVGKILGEEAHAGRPQLGKNAIEAASQLVSALAEIHLDPLVAYSVKMTSIKAGNAVNIIPGEADFTLDLRAASNDQMNKLIAAIRQRTKGVALACETKINIDFDQGTPASVADPTAIAILEKSIVAQLGQAGLDKPKQSSGGDDFNVYGVEHPNLKSTMLGLGCDLKPGLHAPNMAFNHDALVPGIKILENAVLQTFHLSLQHQEDHLIN
ncbi:MAG: amidohydrolase [Oenococcus sp.]|uniref:amidohydrolase n=1 Tax=Oenococcus sp. TaxID=1979414 RepID=UPI0039E94C29